MTKYKRNGLAAVVISISLAGCMTAEQLDQECRSYGFVSGTQGYAQCRMTLAAQQQQARNEAADQMASGLAAAGAAYSHPPPPPPMMTGNVPTYVVPIYPAGTMTGNTPY